ncbi:MAG TPA: tyrosine-type recombinase/integrase [Hyphomicrobium sp.]|nr:tyrosine-type recombinase/integrase [Hyphomicrobium sp.]HWL05803.1 tyrosine-type recombinase/integrase [Xanthobacteraceae bacterium]
MKFRHTNGTGETDLRYVYEDRDRHGKTRIYFRRKGQKKIALKHPPGSPEFFAEYQRAFAGIVAPTLPVQSLVRARAAQGSFRWLVEQYFTADEFLNLDKRTKHVRKLILDGVCLEPFSDEDPTPIGTLPYAEMTTLVIRKLRDRKAGKPEAQNSRLKALRQVFKFGVAEQHCIANPARDVPYVQNVSDGFHTWTPAEVETFRAKHPLGTKARLALEILLLLGVRRSDAVLLGKQHVRAADQVSEELRAIHDGRWVQFTQQKNKNRKPVTLMLPILPDLEAVLAGSPLGPLTWLVTAFNKGFTAAGFGNWFRDRCNEAGLSHCSAHGLRKAGAATAAERGATPHMLMALYGWKTLKEAERYTRAADQKRISGGAMHLTRAKAASS